MKQLFVPEKRLGFELSYPYGAVDRNGRETVYGEQERRIGAA